MNAQKIASIAGTIAGLSPQIETAVMLVGMGIRTVQEVRAFFQTQGHDDETLDAIIADMQRRKQRWADWTGPTRTS